MGPHEAKPVASRQHLGAPAHAQGLHDHRTPRCGGHHRPAGRHSAASHRQGTRNRPGHPEPVQPAFHRSGLRHLRIRIPGSSVDRVQGQHRRRAGRLLQVRGQELPGAAHAGLRRHGCRSRLLHPAGCGLRWQDHRRRLQVRSGLLGLRLLRRHGQLRFVAHAQCEELQQVCGWSVLRPDLLRTQGSPHAGEGPHLHGNRQRL